MMFSMLSRFTITVVIDKRLRLFDSLNICNKKYHKNSLFKLINNNCHIIFINEKNKTSNHFPF